MENPTHAFTPFERQQWRDADRPIGTAAETSGELNRLGDQLDGIAATLTEATKRFQRDRVIADGPHITDAMRATVRADALVPLEQTEADLRRQLALVGRRAQAIARQLADAAETPSMGTLPADVLARAAQMIPVAATQLPSLRLPQITQRLRAVAIRADPAERFAVATAARAHLTDRADTPRPGDTEADLLTAETLCRELGAGFRDTSLDNLLGRGRDTVTAVSAVDGKIIKGRTERGDADPYGFLRGVA